MNEADVRRAFSTEADIDHFDDCKRIVGIVRAHHGVEISLNEAQIFWQDLSDMLAAGWLVLPDEDAEIACDFQSFVSRRLESYEH